MLKTFIIGVIAGLLVAASLVYVIPAVDLERERSMNTVNPNGGTQERFYAKLPGDRIMASVGSGEQVWPAGTEWPGYLQVGDAQTELFKLRNDEDRVVAVASRIKSSGPEASVEWVIHMPARGSVYGLLDAQPDASGTRKGRTRAGTREFIQQSGSITERYEASSGDFNDSDGRLVLTTILVGSELANDLVAEVSE